MTGRLVRSVVVLGVIGFSLVAMVGRADAACHSFTVSVSPASVTEGGKVTVTVERDSNVNPSSVRVTTVDASAKAPGDYTKLDQQVSMTSETTRKLTITTKDDAATEGAETFKVHLHDAAGCAINDDFEYGPDAVVTIKASDPKPAPATPTRAPAPVAQATAQPSPTLSPTAAATAEATPSPEATVGPQAAEDNGGGLPAGAIAGIAAGAAAVASAVGLLLYRRRLL